MTRLFQATEFCSICDADVLSGHFHEEPPTAGVKYDGDKSRMDLISPYAMDELGKVLAYGAQKYSDRNWEQGIAWSRIVGALLRHLFAYLRGERIDRESGCSHLSHVLCNAHFLVHYEHTRTEFDDLPKPVSAILPKAKEQQ
jgi:hypothetical protein